MPLSGVRSSCEMAAKILSFICRETIEPALPKAGGETIQDAEKYS